MTKIGYRWGTAGDVNAFFGLMLDNIADLILAVALLSGVFQFPASFALAYMVPGTAVGVFVGDLLFFALAFYLAYRSGRPDVTAMPLGLDTPSTFGMVFFVLGPAFSEASKVMSVEQAATYTWHIGICAIFISGLFKFACALGSRWVQRCVPRAGLLGSLAAVALVLISFLPLVETLQSPVVGLVAVAIILTTLIARVPLPFRVPGALGALVIAGGIHYLMHFAGLLDLPTSPSLVAEWMPTGWLDAFRFDWMARLDDSLKYLPIVLPFALATVIGGIDCTESASAAGDDYHAGVVVGIESVATLIAALCGGVIQTTPYIGHPAYKAMGGRAAYTLATAIFVGSAGVLGFFAYFYTYIPTPTVFPILMFVGLEITSQSFQATPKKHYPAIVLACIPALAALVILFLDNVLGELGGIEYSSATGEVLRISPTTLSHEMQGQIQIIRMLASGFVLTSLLWGAMLATLMDRNLKGASLYLGLAGGASLVGLIHSPFPGSPLFLPWQHSPDTIRLSLHFAAGYFLSALLLLGWQVWLTKTISAFSNDDHTDTRTRTDGFASGSDRL